MEKCLSLKGVSKLQAIANFLEMNHEKVTSEQIKKGEGDSTASGISPINPYGDGQIQRGR